MKYIFTCGGTGGHIYPAIAIADKVKQMEPDAEILFIGTKKGMENRIVPASGYEIKGIDASGISRKNLLSNVKTLQDLIRGGQQADSIIKEFKPDMVIGTGGYVTGAVVMHAHGLKIKTFVHEQNAVPGVANKLLEGMVEKVFISFEASRDKFRHPEKCILTGNPIRLDFKILDRNECRKELGLGDETAVLIFGGSLGAKALNDATLKLIEASRGKNIKLFFITGRRYYDEIKAAIGELTTYPDNLVLIDYADNMPHLMTACDVVVSRAGAIAVSEITACKKPSILVPSPNVTNNHQYHNAKAIADSGAAVMIEEKDLYKDISILAAEVLKLCADKDRLNEMRSACEKTAKLNAADIIYEEIKA